MDLIQPQIIAPVIAVIMVKIFYLVKNLFNKKIKPKDLLKDLFKLSEQVSIPVAVVSAITFASFFRYGDLHSVVLNSLVLIYLVWKVGPKHAHSNWWAVLVGLISAVLASMNQIESNWTWLSSQPSDYESKIYLGMGLVIFFFAETIVFKLKRKQWRKLPTAKKIIRHINATTIFPASLVVLFSFLQLETANRVFTDRIYVYLTFLYLLSANLWAYLYVYKKSKKHLKEEKKHFLKLKKTDKKRKKKAKKKKKVKKN